MLARLLGQLAALGIADVRVLARPALRGRRARRRGRPRARLARHRRRPARDRRRRRRAAAPGIVILPGEIVTHREALAGLLKDPRVVTGTLLGGGRRARRVRLPGALQARARDQRRVALPRRPPAHERVPRRAQGRRRRPARAGRLGRARSPSSPPTRPRSGATSSRASRTCGATALWRAAQRGDEEADDEGDGEDEPADDVRRRARARSPRPRDVVLSPEDEALLRQKLAAAPEDATALALVGLVRSGTHVGVNRLRRLFWARPLSPARGRATPRCGSATTTRTRSCSTRPSRPPTASSRRSSSPPTRATSRAGARTAGFTPNQVTTVSLFIGFLAAAAFATGERWGLVAGAILLQAAFTTDCVDGQLARYTRTFSKLGAWLDSIFDRTKEYVCFAGLAIGAEPHRRPRVDARLRRDHAADGAPLLGLLLRRRARRSVIGDTEQPPVERALDAAGLAAAERRAPRRAASPRRAPDAAAPPSRRPQAAAALAPRAARLAHDRPAARRALGQEDGRVPDRRALRRDLAHRRAVRPARDVRRAAGLGRLRRRSTP